MYISACPKCYDPETKGAIVEIVRKDDDGECCQECWGDLYYVHTDRGSGIRAGDYHHVSESLAINPSQTKVHRKLFPGVDVLPDGRIGFNSVRQQSDYLKKTGFDKHPQKIKKHGKIIA